MMNTEYDAIVVGARCAGSPTAMLLARKGYRVLLVDRATFPSDTMSTHIIHPPGVAALQRWNILDRLRAAGCPPLPTYALDFGHFIIAGALRPADGIAYGLCPRRIVLDQVLVEAAIAAGAELHDGFAVDEILIEHGRVTGIRGHRRSGPAVTERARVVIGADGLNSRVAKAVQARAYHERPTISVGYYAYWRGLPSDRFEGYIRPRRAFAVAPTNDGLTMCVANWPRSEFEANRGNVEDHCLKTFALAPDFYERLRGAKRESPFVGTGYLPNVFRQPYGPGWALVGDAGYHKDPMTAQGISDAFRDAETLVHALDDAFTGRLSFDDALARYQRVRDEAALPMFELTCQFANLEEPPPPPMQELLQRIHGKPEAMSDFLSMLAGVIPPSEFFGPDGQITFRERSSAMR